MFPVSQQIRDFENGSSPIDTCTLPGGVKLHPFSGCNSEDVWDSFRTVGLATLALYVKPGAAVAAKN